MVRFSKLKKMLTAMDAQATREAMVTPTTSAPLGADHNPRLCAGL
jgi:hypothetical protein